jgi:AcrR family transcriptional regulator
VAIKRGNGRQALIEATAAVLSRGEDVQIKEIAATVGVSHTLVYRHFPEGGKDEMVAEAYAQLFRGVAQSDFDRLFTALTAPGSTRDRIRDLVLAVLSPRRANVRWARLEALVQTRVNPYVAERIEGARQALIEGFADRLREIEPGLPPDTAVGLSLLSQSLPLGITAIGGPGLTRRQRETVAELWADAMVYLFDRARAEVRPTP